MEKEKVEKIEKLQEKLDRLEIENEDLQKRLRVEQDKKDDVVELLQRQIQGLWSDKLVNFWLGLYLDVHWQHVIRILQFPLVRLLESLWKYTDTSK